MSDNLHVCQLITALPYGGAEHMVRDLVAASDEIEYTVGYFGSEDPLVPEIEGTGAAVHHFDEKFRFDPAGIWRLHKFLNNREIDILHLHLPYAQTIGRLAGAFHSIDGIVSTQHNVPENYHPLSRITERVTRPLDDRTVAVSNGVEQAFTGRTHTPGDVENAWCTIYNGIDVGKFSSKVELSDEDVIYKNFNINESNPVFLNVGRYVPVKAQTDLIQAFSESDTNAQLIIVGHGELEEKLRRAVADCGVSDSVHITGRVPEVHPYYAAADGFVSASKAEGLPITILEAMAAELPVIAPDIPGVREAVKDRETGILVPSRDIKTIQQTVDELLSSGNIKSYGQAGYQWVSDEFDIGQMSRNYADLYKQLAKCAD